MRHRHRLNSDIPPSAAEAEFPLDQISGRAQPTDNRSARKRPALSYRPSGRMGQRASRSGFRFRHHELGVDRLSLPEHNQDERLPTRP
jgi:hypothetical protein